VAGGLRKFFQTKQITLPSLLNERGHTWKVEIKKGNVGSESNLNIEDKTMNKMTLFTTSLKIGVWRFQIFSKPPLLFIPYFSVQHGQDIPSHFLQPIRGLRS
jgi:hypothetical protein